MTETEKVSRLDHYLWWINNERVSYVLKKRDNSLLYIWHQLKKIDGTTVLIGGWFVCSDDCNVVDVIYALNRQLEITDKEFRGIPWVAVIKKSNIFVQTLNKRFGFKLQDKNHYLFDINSRCFPYANSKNFNLFSRSI